MNDLERRIIDISYRQKLAHIGSSLTAVNIIDHIYSIKAPDDKFILSSGHAAIGYYAVLEKHGFGNAEELFKKHGVHPNRDPEHDIWASTGSLGHGVGIAVGIGLSDRTKNVFCLLSDGETMEGSVWEALRIAEEQRLDNVFFYFNVNGFGGYQAINTYALYNRIMSYQVNRRVYLTRAPRMPGLRAHYEILDEDSYKRLIEER